MSPLGRPLRRLARAPGFTLTAAGTLGFGVAASAVVLAFGYATLVQPVALFPERDRIVDVQATRSHGPGGRFAVYPADFLAWRAGQRSFRAFGAYHPLGEIDLTGHGAPRRLRCHRATGGLFAALGVAPELGRGFSPEEETPGRDRVTVLSDHLWRSLGADPGIVGRTLLLDGELHRVVGVMPPGFGVRGGFPDLWLPLSFGPGRPADRRSATLGVIARLRPGVTLERARADLASIAAALEESFPETNRDLRPSLEPLVPLMTRGLRPTVFLLLAAVAVVLAVAAVNLGNLLLARAIGRDGEMAVRASLGATPVRLALELLGESALLGGLAAVAGTALAAAALKLLPDLQGQFLYRSVELRLGAPVVGLSGGLAFLVGTMAGVVPALRAARAGTRQLAGAAATRGRRAARVTRALGTAQVAATVALLAGSGLLLHSLAARLGADLGYSADRVLSFEVAPPPSRYPDAAALSLFSARLLEELGAVPGVEVAASSDGLPGGGWDVGVWPEDRPAAGEPGAEPLHTSVHLVTPGYFRVLGMPRLAGRGLLPADTAAAPGVAVLSESAARRIFGDDDAVGRRLAIEARDDWHRVVGVVPDVLRRPGEPAEPTIYLAYAQHADLLDLVGVRTRLVLVRAAVAPGALVAAIPRVVGRLDPELPVAAVEPLDARLAALSFGPRVAAGLFSAFALLALVLAAVGLYALLADAVARRRREIGIRIALGADRGDVVRLLARPAAGLTALRVAVGLVAALGLGRAMAGQLFGVAPYDPWALAGAVAVVAAAVLPATLVPARRALRVDPREVLPAE